MAVHEKFNQAHLQNPMALEMALGLSSKREGIKLDLRRGQFSEGMSFLLAMAVFATPIPLLAMFAPAGVAAV
jgi:hypothetical protein